MQVGGVGRYMCLNRESSCACQRVLNMIGTCISVLVPIRLPWRSIDSASL